MSTKEMVVYELEKNKGSFVSGEKLAETLSVSRNAVWKAVSELRKKGYNIVSVQNKGHMLKPESDIISVQGIEGFLDSKKLKLEIHVYDKISSTNSEAKRFLPGAFITHGDDSVDRMLFVAKKQTSGRGHEDTVFESPEGGIYMSLMLKADGVDRERVLRTAGITAGILSKLFSIEVTNSDNRSINAVGEKVGGIFTEALADVEMRKALYYIVGIGFRYDMMKKITDFDDLSLSKNRIIAELVKGLLAEFGVIE